MPFKVTARAILELGSELISSDAVAFYELIKNAIDAGSKSGVDITIVNTLSHLHLVSLQDDADPLDDSDTEVKDLVDTAIGFLENDAPAEHVEAFKSRLATVRTVKAFKKAIAELYDSTTYITIVDKGTGMTFKTLETAFLTVGTSSRQAEVKKAIDSGKGGTPPFLGEKGVGRLSAMRLGEVLDVRTATKDDSRYNLLHIDWADFANRPDVALESIEVAPEHGPAKDKPAEHGTVITIRRLNASWSLPAIKDMAMSSLSKILDPYNTANEQFPIRLRYNRTTVDYLTTVRNVLTKNAHGRIRGEYAIQDDGTPRLTINMTCPLYQGVEQRARYDGPDIKELLKDQTKESPNKSNKAPTPLVYTKEVPYKSLKSLGPFSFELFWFNRSELPKPPGFDSVTEFRALLNQWMGIMVYRDGYQVLPYGELGNDWLHLDRKALASPGFKLNKIQFAGRVNIGRLTNPTLIDQTNREGLRDCDEKAVLIGIVKYAIQNEFKTYIEEAQKAMETEEFDETKAMTTVKRLARDTEKALGRVQGASREDKQLMRKIGDMFDQLLAQYMIAAERVRTVEDEHEQLIQLAGIGLAVETVAHELSRIVHHTYELLRKQNLEPLPAPTRSFFDNIRAQITTIDKRLRVIDPLSVSGRNRKSDFDLRAVAEKVIDSHQAQLERHNVKVIWDPERRQRVMVNAVEGKIIQILENLLTNSLYWIAVLKEEPGHGRLEGKIKIKIRDNPPGFEFSDNGLGVPEDRAQKIFRPFFSTRRETKRRGLGLFIAKENAIYHGGELFLDTSKHKLANGRYSTFVLELPQSEGK